MDARRDEPRSGSPCCGCRLDGDAGALSRRDLLAALGGAVVVGLSWSALRAAGAEVASPPPREPLVVKPVFAYGTYRRRPQASWRPWGGVETQKDAEAETARIGRELAELKKKADFPLEFLPLARVRSAGEAAKAVQEAKADALLLYAAAGPTPQAIDAALRLGKPVIVFVRHRSGPLYLWYEIIHPRYLRAHSDHLARKGIDYEDVVVDSQGEILWRLRALCGLKNTVGSRIVAIGGAGGWAHGEAPKLARDRWKLEIHSVPYPELGKLIAAADADKAATALARERADRYLKSPGVRLETERGFVERCFLLDQVFRGIMAKVGAKAITVNACMGTIMRVARTTACLTLSTLNDDGYLAFCESDFVVIPAGILMGNITGHPTFLHNPTYPHDGIITLAHCTSPRKMDGKSLEPVRIVTHYESDYGAAPKVEMRKGQQITSIIPDFEAKVWHGLTSEIVEAPFYPICRTQIEARYQVPDHALAEAMRGFHWMTVYGDYLREAGYALKRTSIAWKTLA